jgi:hypothetical protein
MGSNTNPATDLAVSNAQTQWEQYQRDSDTWKKEYDNYRKAMESGSLANNYAATAARGAQGQALAGARTAGLSKGQAAMAAGGAGNNVYGNALAQGNNVASNLMNSASSQYMGAEGNKIASNAQMANIAAGQPTQAENVSRGMSTAANAAMTAALIFSDKDAKKDVKKTDYSQFWEQLKKMGYANDK